MSPNAVTSIRLVLLAPLFIALLGQGQAWRWAAVGLFLTAGATDIVDGWMARRFGKVSVFGGMLDLMADRLLTTVTVIGLVARGGLDPWVVAAGLVLVGRCAVVATMGEAYPGRLDIRVTPVERVKIALQFAGLALLIAPPVIPAPEPLARWGAGGVLLMLSAAFTLGTLVVYGRRALAAATAQTPPAT